MSAPGALWPRRAAVAAALLVVAWGIAGVGIVADGLRDRPGTADLGVVLGSKVNRDGTLSARLRARLDRGVELYRGGQVLTLMVSGGVEPTGHDEARMMSRYLLAQGIPAGRIVEDRVGDNTWLTAAHVRGYLDGHRLRGVVVVSQYFHLPRCRLALARHGVRPVATAHARFTEWRDLYSIAREVPALVEYAFRPAP